MNVNTNKASLKLKVGSVMLLTFCALLYACKEKYLPSVKDVNPNYLVVDGFINTGADSTIFRLSRTFKLESKAVMAPEKAAIVAIENDAGGSYLLPELPTKPGVYAVPALKLDQTKKYRLRIRTKDKREYLSDFVECKISPPVDELKYDLKNDQVNVYAYTHDPGGNSRYYRYSCIETVEYTSSLQSVYKVQGNKVVDRSLPEDMIWRCYRSTPSTDIVLASTATLTLDELADKFIISVPRGSLKIRLGYSVAVRQSVLTKEGFDFFESLKKNTESVGTIFDAQPSQLFGNIHPITDPSEIVIGFISAGTVTEKRVTIMSRDLPESWFKPREIDSLCLNTVHQLNEESLVALHPVWIPLTRAPFLTYNASKDIDCVDCRRQGGTNIRPPYWPL